MEDPQQPFDLARLLIVSGLMLLVAGGVVLLINKFGISRMPGDMKFGDDNFRVYIPLGSCVLISVVLTLIMWLVRMLGK